MSTQNAPERSLHMRHLFAEIARLDILLQHQVRRWQQAGQDPGDAFRGLHLSDDEAEKLLQRPLAAGWGQAAALPPAEVQEYEAALDKAARKIADLVETARRQGQALRLLQLAATFGLERFDLDALLICLAPALDLRYERVYSYLQDDVTRKRPTPSLVLDILGAAGPERWTLLAHFGDDAPLFRHALLERPAEPGSAAPPLLGQPLAVDEGLVAWLLGRYQPPADLGPYATLHNPQEQGADRLLAVPLEPFDWTALAALPAEEKPLVAFHGPDRASQRAAALQLARRAGRPLLTVDLAAAVQADVPAGRALRLALRDARLTGAIPCLEGWDACLTDGAPAPELTQRLYEYPGLAIVAGQAAWQTRGIERDRRLLWIEFAIPTYGQRQELWKYFLSDIPEAGQLDLGNLSGQFALTAGQIRDAVAAARDAAAQRGRPVQDHDLLLAARVHSNPRLGTLARKIEPRYGWADIILPDDPLAMLHEIVACVRGRPVVLEEWGVGKKLVASSGVPVLFSGPPGTGKTMAAEVIASELGLELFKIDLSGIVSKYIGETEKNLEQIFSEAEHSNAILFFDEADAIFGKRSEVKDAHDRYANIEISYLLQRMEAYNGVTVLATNLRANLDEAFTRRLQFAVDFPFPEEEYRLRIWETLFPANVPREPDVDFTLLARRFKLAGGGIRNCIVNAAYLAAADGRQVSMAHLLHGVRRELQKMGRLVKETDMQV